MMEPSLGDIRVNRLEKALIVAGILLVAGLCWVCWALIKYHLLGGKRREQQRLDAQGADIDRMLDDMRK